MKLVLFAIAITAATLAGCSRTSDAEKKHQEELKAILSDTSSNGQRAAEKETSANDARSYLEQQLREWQDKGKDGGDPLMRPYRFADKLLDYKIVSVSKIDGSANSYRATVNMKVDSEGATRETQVRYKVSYGPLIKDFNQFGWELTKEAS